MVTTSAFEVAGTFLGLSEVQGTVANPTILAMLHTDDTWPQDDAVPWCSAFLNFVFKLLGLQRSRSLRARSWLRIGTPIELTQALPDSDVVIFKTSSTDPGPNVVDCPGHVALFSKLEGTRVHVRGGNQHDSVCDETWPIDLVIGVRRVERK